MLKYHAKKHITKAMDIPTIYFASWFISCAIINKSKKIL
ncbi:hypothetical protein BRDCF_p945 [Bacteroidales bacterium CF]|nr:hypothetical protein BRDCF_p945 [Bacteroidales bacterium CF]